MRSSFLCSVIGHTSSTFLHFFAVIGSSASLERQQSPGHVLSVFLGVPCLPLAVSLASCRAPSRTSDLPCDLQLGTARGQSKCTKMSKDTLQKSEKIMDMECKALWYPDSKRDTQMDKFRRQVNKDYGLNLANYHDLYQWSVDNYPEFWSQVWNSCGVVCSKPYDEVVDTSKRISDVPQWFRGARLNYAENLLKYADQDKVALYAATEKMKK
ncbi:hypothetical protein WMY93_005265 [Mugilogobius chulae]|uniref:Acetyl-coenzyme A synthetase N-terminal domain-containing protein n=1 Tax=Mugilogobius chulae TaxID=88201 RepID=A0AAW0PZ97_9GOBI